MRCVTSVRYQIKVNGTLTQQFRPSRGLRQGDPASPYLFAICAEGLSALLHDAERSGQISGVKVCPNAPVVSHLFFADDSVLLMRATQDEAMAMKRVLELYERSLGNVSTLKNRRLCSVLARQ